MYRWTSLFTQVSTAARIRGHRALCWITGECASYVHDTSCGDKRSPPNEWRASSACKCLFSKLQANTFPQACTFAQHIPVTDALYTACTVYVEWSRCIHVLRLAGACIVWYEPHPWGAHNRAEVSISVCAFQVFPLACNPFQCCTICT